MATRQVIKTGTTVDDGTGDLLRDAFVKVNTNFENVWDKTAVNSNLDFTGDTMSSTGELILSPASDIKTTKSIILNSNKGNFDLTVHGDTSDNVLFVDASTNKVGILNNAPTVALDVTGAVAVSAGLTVSGTTLLNGNTTFGDASSDILTYVARVGSNIEPTGSVTIGSVTNRWASGYYTGLDVSGNISGNFTGTVDAGTTLTNNINSTTIIGDTITATTSAEVGNLLVTGTLAVQGASVTIDSATMQILDKLTFEGATADAFETSVVATDPTADRTINLPDADGNIALFTTAPATPITDGTSGQVLTTNGSGVLSFVSVSALAGAGINLTDLSITTAAAGTAALTYNDGVGVFTYTPPDLSSYLTSVPAQSFTSLTGKPTTIAGYGITDAFDGAFGSLSATPTTVAGYGITDAFDGAFGSLSAKPTTVAGYGITDSYVNTDVDTHINQSNPTSGYVLSWNGSDYAWVSNAGGGGLTAIIQDTSPQLGGTLDANSYTIDMGTNVLTDAKVGNWDTAFGWGDHGGAGYQTTSGLNAAIDTHINQSNPTSGYVLSWDGSDYAWVAGGGGIALTDLSVGAEGSASGDGDIAYNSGTGIFTYTPPDLSTYLTSVPAQSFASLTSKPTTIAGYGITDAATQYANSDVDTHLNQSGPTSGYVLSWNGSDYAWVTNSGGSGIALTDLSVGAEGSASGDGAIAYNSGTGVFTYTPPDTSTYITASSTDTLTNKSITKAQVTDLLTGDFNVGTNKILYSNVYATEGDLPTASSYHGMFAHVHATGAGYFAHGGAWVKLANNATTLAGYGITDGYVNTDVDAHLNQSNPTSGYVLSWNGSDYAWVANTGSGGTPGGSTTQIQFNNAGSFGGDADLTWTTGTNTLTVKNIVTESISADPSLSGTYTIASPTTITLDPVTEVILDAPMKLVSKTVAQLGSLTSSAGAIVSVSDNGYKPSYYDGSAWRYFSDNSTV